MKVRKSILLLVVMISFLMGGCRYDWIYEEVPDINPNVPVSFSQQILPIFTGNNCISCHDGSPSPDLSAGNAYTSISSNYINTAVPEESIIYTKPLPDGGHFKKYSTAQAALLLNWIKQGAQNN